MTAKCRGPFSIPIENPVRFDAQPGEQLFFVVSPGCTLAKTDAAAARALMPGNTRVGSSRLQAVAVAPASAEDRKPAHSAAVVESLTPAGYATPLPADLAIVQPGPDVSPAAAAFSGVWVGKWAGKSDHTLVVERMEGRRAFLVYALNPE